MRFFKRLVVTLVAVVVVLVAISFLLPRNVAVSRSIVINAPAEAIFPQVNALAAGQNWSPWLERDPNIQIAYDGPEQGVGNMMRWTSEVRDVGNGAQEIVASVENERVETALDFGSMGNALAAFDLVASGAGTEVTWSFQTDMGMNPIARYMGLVMDRWVGADYEKGLANLKALIENG